MPSNDFLITPRKGHCDYYNLPIGVIEDPEFPFTCERMTGANECPPDCQHYNVVSAVVKAHVR